MLKNRGSNAVQDEDKADELVRPTEQDADLEVRQYKEVVPPPLQIPKNKQFMEALKIKDELEIEKKQIRMQRNEIVQQRNDKDTSVKDSLMLLQEQMELDKRNSELMNTIEAEMKKYHDGLKERVNDTNNKHKDLQVFNEMIENVLYEVNR